MPSSWEGWAVTLAAVIYIVSRSVHAEHQPVQFVVETAIVVSILLVVSRRKTKGDWKWRWG